MIFEKRAFRLGESAILRVRGAELTSRWSYVGTELAYVGLRLDLYWLQLATVGRKVAYVGPCWVLCWPQSGLGGLPGASPNPFLVRIWPKMRPRWGQDGQDEAKLGPR